jgi:hypothetical protein
MKALLATLVLVSGVAHARFKPIPDGEQTDRLLSGQREITSLLDIRAANLESGATGIDLWSGSYWPQYEGLLAIRYRDPEFASLMSADKSQFKTYKELFAKKPYYSYRASDELSPAEKYDLLVGDPTMGLTAYSWALGDKTGKDSGKVPTWRGICDGFSSAAQMMPRPAKAVTLNSPNGQPITFYPEDIKALGSLSYSRSQKNPIFLGKRCISKAIPFSDACDETNPGAFHKALVNRVGALKKSFVADVSPGSEVWNYPVKSYQISYYNVFSEVDSKDFKESLESFDPKKKFAKKDRRDKRTAYIVGVTAKVQYADMRFPHTNAVDDVKSDKTMEMIYTYDLELDRNLNILGGESASKNLPDFIWAPNDRVYPLSDVEETTRVTDYNLSTLAAAASKKGQPLSMIIQRLFESAK